MTDKTDCRRDCAVSADDIADMAPAQELMPVWRASVRMALVTAASLLAAGLIVTGLGGCADMSGIAPTGALRDAASLGLTPAASQAEPQQRVGRGLSPASTPTSAWRRTRRKVPTKSRCSATRRAWAST